MLSSMVPVKQVGILQHNSQGMPQIILFDPAHVNAVVGEPPSVYIVKPVDQIGDGGFSSPL